MADQRDSTTGKKPWPGVKIVDIGSVDEHTTAGVGNLGDQTGTDRWKPTAVHTPEDARAILPDGE
jgi:hypothetical protein